MVSQSGRIEGVAFSAPQPEALAPLFDALGAVAQPRQCLEKEAAVQRFGLSAGRAEITPFLLGREEQGLGSSQLPTPANRNSAVSSRPSGSSSFAAGPSRRNTLVSTLDSARTMWSEIV